MNIIEKLANEVYTNYIQRGPKKHDEVLLKVREKINNIDNKFDKIIFLQFILNKTNIAFQEHLPVCPDPDNCRRNDEYKAVIYYLQQELQRLGLIFNEDTFTENDIVDANQKIDEVLIQISKLELGQEVIYEDIQKEIDELKSFYFVGKKTWYQLFIGKLTEMSIGGVVSETVSKGLIQIVRNGMKLLGF